jgi:hypothetical protein
MFSKTVRSLVQITQTMINIPDEAFLGGFANIFPQKLYCYQKNNMQINKKLLIFEENDGTISIYQR